MSATTASRIAPVRAGAARRRPAAARRRRGRRPRRRRPRCRSRARRRPSATVSASASSSPASPGNGARPALTSSTTRGSMSQPTTSCPASAICAASGSPTLPSATTTARFSAARLAATTVSPRAALASTASATRDGLQALLERDDRARRRRRASSAQNASSSTSSGSRRAQRVARHVALGDAAQRLRRRPALRSDVRRCAKNVRSAVSVSATSMPRSPSTRVRRTLVGVSQSTIELNAHAALEPAGDEHEVLVLAAHAVLGLRGDALDRRAAEPADEVEVVGGEVLDDADVAHAVGERPDALGGDRGRPRRAGRRCTRRRSSSSAGLKRSTWPTAPCTPALAHGVDELARLVGGRGQRLLDQHVHARARPARARPRRCSSVGTATIAKSGRPARRAARRATRRPAPGRGRRRSGRRRGRRRRRTSTRGEAWSSARGGGRSCRGRATAPRSGLMAVARSRRATRVSAHGRDRRPRARPQPDAQVGARRALRRQRRRPRRRRASATASSIQDGAMLGKPPVLAPTRAAARDRRAAARDRAPARGSARAGDRVRGRARSAPGAIVGDQAYVRERARDRRRARWSAAGSAVDNDVVVGDARADPDAASTSPRFSSSRTTSSSGPCAMTTNDDTMGRHAPGRRRCAARRCAAPAAIGGGAVLVPGRRGRRGGVRRRRRGRHARRPAAGGRHGRPGARRARGARRGAARAVALRRRAAPAAPRGTPTLGSPRPAALAVGAAAGALAGGVWRRGSAPLPARGRRRARGGRARPRARRSRWPSAGYRGGTAARERAAQPARLVHATFGASRLSSATSSAARGALGPVPQRRRSAAATSTTSSRGSCWRSLAGGASIVTRDEDLEPWLALPFGAGRGADARRVGAAAASSTTSTGREEGVLSVQITLAAIAAARRARARPARLLRRGEARGAGRRPGPAAAA